MKTYTHETHVSPQRPNETDEGYSRRIADTLHNAAPELLQALKALSVAVRDAGKEGTAGNLARAEAQALFAISKAEGRA